MSKSSNLIKKTLKSKIFNLLYSLICKSQELSFAQLKYKSLSFRILAYFAGEELQKKVVWFKAAENGDTKKIFQIYERFEDKKDIDIKNQEGNTALDLAKEKNYKDMISLLEKASGNQKGKDTTNQNLDLRVASLERDFEKAKKLVESGADIDFKDKSANTAMYRAIRDEDLDMVKKLVELGANLENKIRGETALHFAILTNPKMVKDLVGLGADLKTPRKDGNTALHIAVWTGNINIVKDLLELGADLKTQNHIRGNTALHIAVSRENLNMIKDLLELGADLETRSLYGDTILHSAVSQGSLNMVKDLLKLGAKLEAKNNKGCTVLHIAISNKNPEILTYLIGFGADLDATDTEGKTALDVAKHHKKEDMILLLEKAIADRDKKVTDHKSAKPLSPFNLPKLARDKVSTKMQPNKS